jgi:alpha-beta hydrolase superfamily lysophospholipase
MTEDVLICSAERSLVGVLTTPAESDADGERPTVIILNAGLLHRVGPNRIYVKLARALAAIGFSVLRLDLSGIGESQARSGTEPIDESVHADVRNAMDTLARTRGASRFVLMGHCSGAAFSLLIAARDPRVAAAVIINPEMASEEWNTFDQQRKVANYYANFYGRGATWTSCAPP